MICEQQLNQNKPLTDLQLDFYLEQHKSLITNLREQKELFSKLSEFYQNSPCVHEVRDTVSELYALSHNPQFGGIKNFRKPTFFTLQNPSQKTNRIFDIFRENTPKIVPIPKNPPQKGAKEYLTNVANLAKMDEEVSLYHIRTQPISKDCYLKSPSKKSENSKRTKQSSKKIVGLSEDKEHHIILFILNYKLEHSVYPANKFIIAKAKELAKNPLKQFIRVRHPWFIRFKRKYERELSFIRNQENPKYSILVASLKRRIRDRELKREINVDSDCDVMSEFPEPMFEEEKSSSEEN